MKHLWLLIFCGWLVVAMTAVPLVAAQTGVSPLPTPTARPEVPGDGEETPVVALSGTGLAAITALLLSLALSYIPGFSAFWEGFTYKREALAGLGLLAAVALVGLHYVGAINLELGVFGWPVVWRVIESWLAFSGAGQLAFTGKQALRGGSDAGVK